MEEIKIEYRYKLNRDTIKSIIRHEDVKSLFGKEVTCCGWILTVRDQKENKFVQINDGSCSDGLQILINSDNEKEKGSFEKFLEVKIIFFFFHSLLTTFLQPNFLFLERYYGSIS